MSLWSKQSLRNGFNFAAKVGTSAAAGALIKAGLVAGAGVVGLSAGYGIAIAAGGAALTNGAMTTVQFARSKDKSLWSREYRTAMLTGMATSALAGGTLSWLVPGLEGMLEDAWRSEAAESVRTFIEDKFGFGSGAAPAPATDPLPPPPQDPAPQTPALVASAQAAAFPETAPQDRSIAGIFQAAATMGAGEERVVVASLVEDVPRSAPHISSTGFGPTVDLPDILKEEAVQPTPVQEDLPPVPEPADAAPAEENDPQPASSPEPEPGPTAEPEDTAPSSAPTEPEPPAEPAIQQEPPLPQQEPQATEEEAPPPLQPAPSEPEPASDAGEPGETPPDADQPDAPEEPPAPFSDWNELNEQNLKEAIAPFIPAEPPPVLQDILERMESKNDAVRAQAIKDFGHGLYNGAFGLPENDQAAFAVNHLAIEVSDSRNAQAIFNEAYSYLHGVGTETDHAQAKAGFEKALALGYERACFFLDYMEDVGLIDGSPCSESAAEGPVSPPPPKPDIPAGATPTFSPGP